jgi:hypothetical protein
MGISAAFTPTRASMSAGLTKARSSLTLASASVQPVSTTMGCGPPRMTHTKKWRVSGFCDDSRKKN